MYNNSNEMLRGYFMRQSEGGYAPKNFKYNQKPNNNNKNKNKNKKIRGVQALLNPSTMMQKPYKKKKSSSKK
jgi:phage terminase large subunit-like protein